jgi:hypothetical protein
MENNGQQNRTGKIKMDNSVGKGLEWGMMKEPPKVLAEAVEKAIQENDIYTEALNYYKKQIAYGIQKYPETLNEGTWSIIETIEHEIGELVDTLNYKVMLKRKLQKAEAEGFDLRKIFG